jgi:cyclin-dependent kinase 8/11
VSPHPPKDMDKALKQAKDDARLKIHQEYTILGFLSAGTYGKVYKAIHKHTKELVAIKKFKPERELDLQLSSFSQSALREISICMELECIRQELQTETNIISLNQVSVNPLDRSIHLVFAYAEYDFLQLLQFKQSLNELIIKSLLYQLINGVALLHSEWILHRDLKPANILLQSDGTVKIADLGLARLFQKPLVSLFSGDKVVVTIWYRAPELLLGSRHYTTAIDMWAIGCIFGELLIQKPLFKGEEAKVDNHEKMMMNQKRSNIPFQRHQLTKIFEILGTPDTLKWPTLSNLPEYANLLTFPIYTISKLRPHISHLCPSFQSDMGFDLLEKLLEYDPCKRLTAQQALDHPWFKQEPRPIMNPFEVVFQNNLPPPRKVIPLDSNDVMAIGKQDKVREGQRKRRREDVVPGLHVDTSLPSLLQVSQLRHWQHVHSLQSAGSAGIPSMGLSLNSGIANQLSSGQIQPMLSAQLQQSLRSGTLPRALLNNPLHSPMLDKSRR